MIILMYAITIKTYSESIDKIIFLKSCQNKLIITIRHTQAACLWRIIKHKYSQMGWNNIYINCGCFFIIDQIRASWRNAPYAHITIPLVDYSHIDWHCKANVQARICVDLNSVTTHQISESSLLLKNKFTSKLEKKSSCNFNYETYNFVFGKFATLICIADFDNFFYITYHLVEYLRNFVVILIST